MGKKWYLHTYAHSLYAWDCLQIWVHVHSGLGANSDGIQGSRENSGSWSPHLRQKTPSMVQANLSLPHVQIGSAYSKSAADSLRLRAINWRFAYRLLFHSR